MNEYMTSFIARMIFGMMEKTEMLFVKGGGTIYVTFVEVTINNTCKFIVIVH